VRSAQCIHGCRQRSDTDHTTATLPAPKSIDHTDKTQRKSLLGACAVHFVHDGIGDALYVLLPIWGQAFALSYTQIGMLRAAYSTSLAFLQMPAGLLAERVGVVRLLVAGTIVAGACFALFATAGSFVSLGMLILLAGIGSSVQHPLSSEIISKAYGAATRRAALGVYNFSGDLGKMTVTSAAGLGVAMIGWTNTAVAYGVVVGLVGLLASYALRHLSAFDRGTGSVSARPPFFTVRWLNSCRRIARVGSGPRALLTEDNSTSAIPCYPGRVAGHGRIPARASHQLRPESRCPSAAAQFRQLAQGVSMAEPPGH
jgi:MFS family permease